MRTIRSIMVGVDFSSASRTALFHAGRIANWANANLSAVHLIDRSLANRLWKTELNTKAEHDRILLSSFHEQLSEFAGQHLSSVKAELQVGIDNRVSGFLRSAEKQQADLIVIGCPDDGRKNLGQLPKACIRQSDADVLLVRDTGTRPFRKIVAAIDFSDQSQRVLQQAAYFAARDSAHLVLAYFHEASWSDRVLHPFSGDLGSQQWHEREEIIRSELTEFSRRALANIPEENIELHVELGDDHRSRIGDLTDETFADLIVLGTRPPNSLRDRLLGSTWEMALGDSQCSALVVKPVASELSSFAA